MKPDSVILLVQGEGRGHMTQAMAVADMLRKSGIQIKHVLVGVSNARELPAFFLQAFSEPVEVLVSPGFTKKTGGVSTLGKQSLTPFWPYQNTFDLFVSFIPWYIHINHRC